MNGKKAKAIRRRMKKFLAVHGAKISKEDEKRPNGQILNQKSWTYRLMKKRSV